MTDRKQCAPVQGDWYGRILQQALLKATGQRGPETSRKQTEKSPFSAKSGLSFLCNRLSKAAFRLRGEASGRTVNGLDAFFSEWEKDALPFA